jgi:hypothetical protein
MTSEEKKDLVKKRIKDIIKDIDSRVHEKPKDFKVFPTGREAYKRRKTKT